MNANIFDKVLVKKYKAKDNVAGKMYECRHIRIKASALGFDFS
jgi:hypothetical protein